MAEASETKIDIVNNNPVKILIVDDDRVTRLILERCIEGLGHESLIAVNGREAMEVLEKTDDIDLILLDREMPEMNGMEVVKAMKESPKFSKIPIIMATGSNDAASVKEGTDAGVFYYLAKPIDESILRSVISAAERDVMQRKTLSSELGKHKKSFNMINLCEFHVRAISEAEDLAVFLANCYPDPDRVVSGIAELLVNSIEHGNLALSYDEKSELIDNGNWREELERRGELSEYKNRKSVVTFRRNEDGLYLKILDEGEGFNWRKYLDIDPARATDNHGRGIAQAKAVSFDELNYNTAGNQVVAIVRDAEELDW